MKIPKRDLSDLDMKRGPLAHDIELSECRPPVPGEAMEYVYMPSRGFMTGRLIKKGQVLRVIDLEGEQCFDCIIWDAENLANPLNCMNTQLFNRKWDKWQPGDVIYSKNCDRLVMITEDTTGGTHAVIGFMCSEPYWRARLGIPGAPNCRDNFAAAMASYDFSANDIDGGSCISFFMPVIYKPDGSIGRSEVTNKPGDYIDLMAEMDIIVAISNCPSERSPVNAYNPTAMQAVIFNPDNEYRAMAKSLRR